MSETVRCRAVVSGRVQGVWFREGCRRQARELGVAGWVRNEMDGTVVIEAEGPPPAVDRLLGWSREGPPAARVERVEVTDVEPVGQAGFQVR